MVLFALYTRFALCFLIFLRNTYSVVLSGYVPLCRCFDCYEDLFATRACCTISPCGLYWSSCFLLLLCWWQFTRSFPEYFYSLRCSSDFNIRRVSILFYLSHFFTAFLESMRSRILLLCFAMRSRNRDAWRGFRSWSMSRNPSGLFKDPLRAILVANCVWFV